MTFAYRSALHTSKMIMLHLLESEREMCLATQRYPDPRLFRLFHHKRPQLIQFQDARIHPHPSPGYVRQHKVYIANNVDKRNILW